MLRYLENLVARVGKSAPSNLEKIGAGPEKIGRARRTENGMTALGKS